MIAFLVAACGAPSPRAPEVTRSHRTRRCDVAEWTALAAGTHHAWLGDTMVTVLDLAGDDVEIASVTPSLIVTRWVPKARLGRAAMADVEVAPGVRVVTGRRLGATSGDGFAVADEAPLAVAGVVPARLAGVIWDEPVIEPRRRGRWMIGAIRSDASSDAPIRATLTAPGDVELRGLRGDWLAVTARVAHAEVEGFMELPPPPKPAGPESDQGEEIDLGPTSPLAVDACLYDAPGGHLAGMAIGEQPSAVPVAAGTPGWFRVTLPTAWGPANLVTDSPPYVPPPVEEWHGWPATETPPWR